jgi:hypothetical protein
VIRGFRFDALGAMCSLASTWLANDKLLCRVPAGAGKALPISVEVTGRKAFVNDAFSYESPLISKVGRSHSGSTAFTRAIVRPLH